MGKKKKKRKGAPVIRAVSEVDVVAALGVAASATVAVLERLLERPCSPRERLEYEAARAVVSRESSVLSVARFALED
jgi:hypothetical protein